MRTLVIYILTEFAGWKSAGPAAESQVLRLQIALQQGDVEAFEQHVMDVSTPSNKKYGQHFQTHEEMKRMLLPTEAATSSVAAWLKAAGVEEVEQDADWVTIKTTVGVANKMLETQFAWFVSEEEKPRKVLRALEYSVPEDVATYINLVQPTTRFAAIRASHETEKEIFGLQRIDFAAGANATVNCDIFRTFWRKAR